MKRVRCFWLVFTSEGIDSPGRFDMFMIDYYDMSEKNDRRECLEKLWDVFHQTRTWNLCISGSDEFWNDQSNDLTYDILEVARKIQV
ncbi:MAG: pyruvate formate lyase family protein [Clostridiales bacterium]|nr:MAG: pyruvate formate lyase family protein [Clostridiales bacterium]